MNKSFFPRANSLVFALVGVFLSIVLSHAAVPPVERLLPSDTLFVLSAPDYSKLREIYLQSPMRLFWDDPAMKPFREKFEKKWNEELIVPLERDLGVKFSDYGALLQGQITLAVTQDGWEGKSDAEPGFVFLLDSKDKSDQLKKSIAEFRKKWTDAGKTIKTEKIRDAEFIIITLTTNDVPKTIRQFFPESRPIEELGKEGEKKKDDVNRLYIGQHESLLIIGSAPNGDAPKSLEKILAKLTGGSAPVLGDLPAFESSRLAVFRDAPAFLWINTKAFVDVFNKLPDEKPNPDAPNPMPLPDKKKIVTALGIAGLKSIAAGYRSAPDGAGIEVLLGIPESAREGLFKIFATEAKDAAPPAFVPADAVKFQRVRIDLPKAIASIEKILGDISPQMVNMLNFFISNGNEAMRVDEPGFDIRKNIFANLGDDLITYEKVPRDTSLTALSSAPSLTLVGSPAADKLAASLKGILVILNASGGKPETREFLGRKIYSMKLPSPQTGAGDKAASRSFNYAASGGYVAFSTDIATLEEFLRSSETPPKPLREVAGLGETAQKVGGQGTGWFGYENQTESMRMMMEALRKSSSSSTNSTDDFNPLVSALPFAAPEKKFKDWIDFSLLPPFDAVSKYFGYSVYSCNANVDGITLKYFSPVPAQLKK